MRADKKALFLKWKNIGWVNVLPVRSADNANYLFPVLIYQIVDARSWLYLLHLTIWKFKTHNIFSTRQIVGIA